VNYSKWSGSATVKKTKKGGAGSHEKDWEPVPVISTLKGLWWTTMPNPHGHLKKALSVLETDYTAKRLVHGHDERRADREGKVPMKWWKRINPIMGGHGIASADHIWKERSLLLCPKRFAARRRIQGTRHSDCDERCQRKG
jgi:hypothetical protein